VPANAPASPAVVPTMQSPAQVVLPAPVPEAVSPAATIAVQPAAPVIREVAPGENPFGPSTTTAAEEAGFAARCGQHPAASGARSVP
ncbi:MAG: hypothetical protein ACK4UZ_06590, partial [Rhizobium rhizophilum]